MDDVGLDELTEEQLDALAARDADGSTLVEEVRRWRRAEPRPLNCDPHLLTALGNVSIHAAALDYFVWQTMKRAGLTLLPYKVHPTIEDAREVMRLFDLGALDEWAVEQEARRIERDSDAWADLVRRMGEKGAT